jgi:hypothetical protein
MNRLCLFLLAFVLILSACGDSGPDAATRGALVGVWQDVAMDETVQFMEDGQGKVGIDKIHYKWVSESEIQIVYGPTATWSIPVRYLVAVDADTLVLTWQEDDASYTQTYRRVQ